jgi:hypothetical protein
MADMIAGYSQPKKEGHSPREEKAAAPVEQPTILNELPSVQGSQA